MNRKIKFRAWNSERKKIFFGPTDDSPSPSWILALPQVENFPIPIMQFTGFIDKNGKEIYEGDIAKGIIEFRPDLLLDQQTLTGQIIFHKGEFAFHRPGCHFGLKFFFELEVIGNIYENPNL